MPPLSPLSPVALLVLVASSPARAGSGPWVLGPADHTLYLGLEAQRFDHLAQSSGSGADDVIQVSDGVQTFGAKAIATVGLLPRLEGELSVPWSVVRNNRPDDSPCDLLGLDACEETQGIGIIRARAKALVVDEILGPPVSVALGGELRLGQLTSTTRQRITNLGEGTLDAGGFASVGRIGTLGKGYWSGYVEAGGRYRSRNRSYDEVQAPGAELWAEGELLVAPRRSVAIGPTATWLHRPEGVDVEDLLVDPALGGDVDRFSALRIHAAQAGVKALVRTGDQVTTSLGVLHTLYAVNNPTDVWTVDLGVSFRGFLRPADQR